MRSGRKFRSAVTAAALSIGLAACADSPNGTDGTVAGGSVTIAQLPQSAPNYIFPFVPPGHHTVQNVEQFQALMYRPLYWIGSGNSLAVDEELSLAELPVWNDTHDRVTIELKQFSWSDGTPLTPRNVAFWIGLLRAEKKNVSYYTPGLFPDNLADVAYDDKANTVTMTLTSPVSPDWFLYSQLSTITPLPEAWDLTGPGTKGSCSSTDPAAQAASCSDVYKYLSEKAKSTATYASEPLWQVVNGPYRLKSFESSGAFTLVANTKYSGSPKPTISELNFVPFTSVSAEYDALRSGQQLTIGYVPSNVLKPKKAGDPPGESPVPGFKLAPVQPWGFSYLLINFNNPTVGPVLRQLYIRQALQSVVNQDLYIEKAANGYGQPAFGPVPVSPESPFTRGMSHTNPYPFDVSRARQLLTSHGWSIPAEGPATCTDPGTGPNQCGAGIAQGQKLSIELESYTGDPAVTQMMSQLSSDASKAGIDIKVTSVAPQQMVADAVQCMPNEPTCKWQLINYGTWILNSYPSGTSLFRTGGGSNIGSYSDPQMDALLAATLTSADPAAIAKYAEYASEQIPVIWLPTMASPVYAVKESLSGVAPISPLFNLTPEKWTFSK